MYLFTDCCSALTLLESNTFSLLTTQHTPPTSAKINFSYSILFHLTTSYSSYFGGKKGISRNKTSFFLLMLETRWMQWGPWAWVVCCEWGCLACQPSSSVAAMLECMRWQWCWWGGGASAKINISYSILFHLTTSYSSYFGGKKGISRNKTSFFLLMQEVVLMRRWEKDCLLLLLLL